MEAIAEEVDIGVGIQRCIVGYECECGGREIVCLDCGCIEPDHEKWCAVITCPEPFE